MEAKPQSVKARISETFVRTTQTQTTNPASNTRLTSAEPKANLKNRVGHRAQVGFSLPETIPLARPIRTALTQEFSSFLCLESEDAGHRRSVAFILKMTKIFR